VGVRRLLARATTVGEWNIAVGAGSPSDFLSSEGRGEGTGDLQWLPKPWSVRYQADPFLLASEGRRFLYYEELLLWSNRGRLRATEIGAEGRPIGPLKTMLPLEEHASYPYVFEHCGALYCVPQTAGRRVMLYRSKRLEGPWRPQVVLLDGVSARDCSLFPFGDRWWLFCTLAGLHPQSHLSDLYVWHARAPWGPWMPHVLQPAKVDIRSSRPAGRPFVVDGRLYRPAQDCGPLYGARVVINRVISLTPAEFEEEVCASVEPNTVGAYGDGLHTLTGSAGLIAIDGYRERRVLNPVTVSATLLPRVLARVSTWGRARS
jgi:hypothetical protein